MTRQQAKTIPDELSDKRSFWRKQLALWGRSGVSQRAFCVRHGLALSTFQWWAKKLRAAPTASFVPLAISGVGAGSAAVIEVELRSRTRLRLEGEAALKALDALVARIR